jgi:hypothetical protein
MRRTSFAFLIPLAFAFAAAGCAPQETLYDAEYPGGQVTASPPAERVAVGHIDVRYEGPVEPTPLRAAAAAPASERDRPRPSPIFFSLGAGHGALGRVDLSTCRDRGLPAGYLRIRATFRPSGHVAHAAVESAAEPPQEALECVSEQLEDTNVPPFDGEDVSLSKIVFVN